MLGGSISLLLFVGFICALIVATFFTTVLSLLLHAGMKVLQFYWWVKDKINGTSSE